MFKFGYVAVLGKPNAGKSTLINLLVGTKVAIVSSKPQTTRDNILGIVNGKNYQIVLIDTPGIHKAATHLDKYMSKNVRTAKAGADVALYLLDGSKMADPHELEAIEKMKNDGLNLIIAKSKCDKKDVCDVAADISFSALTGENTGKLLELILAKLPTSEQKNFEFDEDDVTDKPVKFIVAEYIREAALGLLQQEIPHGVAVTINKFDQTDNLAKIDADIICEKESHKGIIIGKGGKTLKRIGTIAREQAEELLGCKVMLTLFVKVEKNWKDKTSKLSLFGYQH